MSDKIDLKSEIVTRDKAEHYVMTKSLFTRKIYQLPIYMHLTSVYPNDEESK